MRQIKTISTDMFSYEKEYYHKGPVCGIDEVGRGPLAGPVYVACVEFRSDIIEAGLKGCLSDYEPMLNKINDSKKLSPSVRQELYDVIKDYADCYSVKSGSEELIDKINILNATKKLMTEIPLSLSHRPDYVLIDAVSIKIDNMCTVPIIKGDAKSFSIAAASILAKVARDELMVEYDKLYPEYGFAKHKGYGTAEHIAAIKKYGLSPIHRASFCTHFI